MDLAAFAAADYLDVTLAGHPFRVGELTQLEWAPVQAWIKANVPGPLSVLDTPDFRKLPPDLKREVLGSAQEKQRTSWPPSIGSRGWFLALDHDGGHAVALLAILRKHLPAATPEDAARVVAGSTFEEVLPAFAAALGIFGPKSPAPSPGAPAKRKGRGRATTSGTSPSSSSRRRGGRPASSST